MTPNRSPEERWPRRTIQPVAPYVRLQERLRVVADKVAAVDAAQEAWTKLLPNAKLNDGEWEDARERARKATISARVQIGIAKRTLKEVAEQVRRGLYDNEAEEQAAKRLVANAILYFDVLKAEGY